MTPDVQIKTVVLHLTESSHDLPAAFGARIKNAGGKYSDVRKKHASYRFVTVPFSERELIDELMHRYPTGQKTTMVVEDLSSDTLDWERRKQVLNKHMAVFYWQRSGGEVASAFLDRAFREQLFGTDWSTDLARWARQDREGAERQRAYEFGNKIADLRERIAAEAVRIAEGANDIEPLKELAAEYAEVCTQAGVAIERKNEDGLTTSTAIKP